jgi:hypothetical protein
MASHGNRMAQCQKQRKLAAAARTHFRCVEVPMQPMEASYPMLLAI